MGVSETNYLKMEERLTEPHRYHTVLPSRLGTTLQWEGERHGKEAAELQRQRRETREEEREERRDYRRGGVRRCE